MKIIVAAGLALVVHSAVAQDLRNEPIEKDAGRFIERLLKAVPRGSSMQDAIEYVEARGFTACTPHENEPWSPRTPPVDFVQ
jgi:hypothetical protein